jgi:Predicted membrane protein
MNNTRSKSVRFITEAAAIAAMYAALTIFLAPISSGQVQVRLAEALTILPYFTSAAIPGLFAGCLIANFFVGEGIYDILMGPLVTLLAACITARMPSKYLVPLPPVILNAVYVGILLYFTAELPIMPTAVLVAIGETIACYVLGYPLLLLLEKQREKIFERK